VVLAARRARNLDAGFQVLSDPQVTEASRRMGNRIVAWSLILGFASAAAVTAIPL
jgi:hypothetical protein